MSLVLQNNGESIALQLLVNKIATPENLKLKLFKSNTTPAETDTAATYTVADFTGYADVTLTGASWTVSGTAPTSIGYAQQTFTAGAVGGSQSVYGYYYVRASTGDIVASERFLDAPYVVSQAADEIRVTPAITAD
jgi:hypothetical protein